MWTAYHVSLLTVPYFSSRILALCSPIFGVLVEIDVTVAMYGQWDLLALVTDAASSQMP
jgi:hypothetical protein